MKNSFMALTIVAMIGGSNALMINTGRTHTPPGSHIDSKDDAGNQEYEYVGKAVDADVVSELPASPTHSLVQTAEKNAGGISTGRTHTPRGAHIDSKDVAENQEYEYVGKAVDADVVSELPALPTHSLVQTAEKNGGGADADGEETVRVVEADVVDDDAKGNAHGKVEKNGADDVKMIRNAKVRGSPKNADSKVESKSEQEDNDDNDEDDAGGDVVQGPLAEVVTPKVNISAAQVAIPKVSISAVQPHASAVPVATPKANISAVVPSAEVATVLSLAAQKLRSLPSNSNEDTMKDKQMVQDSDEVVPAKAESSSEEENDEAVDTTAESSFVNIPVAELAKTETSPETKVGSPLGQTPTAASGDCDDSFGGTEFNEDGC